MVGSISAESWPVRQATCELRAAAERSCAAPAVAMNGERLQMTRGETELELIPFVEGGELLVVWQLHREGLGSAVEIFTGESPFDARTVPSVVPCRKCDHHICSDRRAMCAYNRHMTDNDGPACRQCCVGPQP